MKTYNDDRITSAVHYIPVIYFMTESLNFVILFIFCLSSLSLASINSLYLWIWFLMFFWSLKIVMYVYKCVYIINIIYYFWWESIYQFVTSRMLCEAQDIWLTPVLQHLYNSPPCLKITNSTQKVTFAVLSVSWSGINVCLAWINFKKLNKFLF